jgi:hypothetical protein
MSRREEALWCALFAAALLAVGAVRVWAALGGSLWAWEVLPCAR